MVKLAKRGTCSKCGKGPRKLINGLCQHECVKKSSTNEGKLPKGNEPPKECHSCKQQEGAGPALNWISCSNPTCRTWYHSVCTDLGESTKEALAVVFWLCPKCVISVKPIWVNINADPEALNRNDGGYKTKTEDRRPKNEDLPKFNRKNTENATGLQFYFKH